MHYLDGSWEESLTILETAIAELAERVVIKQVDNNPDIRNSFLALESLASLIYQSRGELKKAKTLAESAINRIDESIPFLKINLDYSSLQIGLADQTNTRDLHFRKVIELHSTGKFKNKTALARAYAHIGDVDAAVATLNEIETEKQGGDFHCRLAEVCCDIIKAIADDANSSEASQKAASRNWLNAQWNLFSRQASLDSSLRKGW